MGTPLLLGFQGACKHDGGRKSLLSVGGRNANVHSGALQLTLHLGTLVWWCPMFVAMLHREGRLGACKPKTRRLHLSCPLILLCLLLNGSITRAITKKLHIVHLGEKVPGLTRHQARQAHLRTLSTALGVSHEDCGDRVHYSYSAGFNGFAASLSDEEVEAISGMPEVVSVFPSNVRQLATTRSYTFLGLDPVAPNGTWQLSEFGKGVVVGLLDSGVWPEDRSFSPEGMPPPPAYWKGACQVGEQFNVDTCNNKVVGARYYYNGFRAEHDNMYGSILSARDDSGHGSLVASTAAGALVQGANLYGLAYGDARGGAPMAHIAVYKVCWTYSNVLGGCSEADILAAFDDALLDGVDILSVSITHLTLSDYFTDVVAIGAYHAMQRGIFVAVAGGNFGPDPASVVNLPPWVATVVANSIDRQLLTTFTLGDGTTFQSSHLNVRDFNGTSFPLVYAGSAGYNAAPYAGGRGGNCGTIGTLDPAKVTGTVVLCTEDDYFTQNLTGPAQAGAVGVILPADHNSFSTDFGVDIVVCQVSTEDGNVVLTYIETSGQPTVSLDTLTKLNFSPAPVIPAFSAHGPNRLQNEILKPDLTAPGVLILAAWTAAGGPDPKELPGLEFNILSGTSISTPHVAGVAALIKALHRDWSPAAIKSALMTTATLDDNAGNGIITNYLGGPSNPFEFGAGMINPEGAAQPGLVYDITPADYELFLCTVYPLNQANIASLTGNPAPCSAPARRILDLNYPTISVPNLIGRESVLRTLTNVGPAAAVNYTVVVVNPQGVNLTVTPSLLSFQSIGQQLSFTVDLAVEDGIDPDGQAYSFGSVQWLDSVHSVRSVVAVRPSKLAIVRPLR